MALIIAMASASSIAQVRGREQAARGTLRVRFATFNIWELDSPKLSRVDANGRGTHAQLCKAAEVIQRIRPDVLLINEIDFDAKNRKNATLFQERYLKIPQKGREPIEYPYVFFAPVNTGLPTGLDLDNDGNTNGPADAFGYGRYEGQYGMALYSRFPIDHTGARTFQAFKWKDMPGNLMPDGSRGKPRWYAPSEAAVLRLSSKAHWDVPVRVTAAGSGDGATVVHVLASHPTPPTFDGPEDRNGRRNFDEIRLWADYVAGGSRAAYLVDDVGRRGGLAPSARFVIMGDLNADQHKDKRTYGAAAIGQLLESPLVQDPKPRRSGVTDGTDPAAFKTSGFGRIDYVLPSVNLKVAGSGVFWPAVGDPDRRLIDGPDPSSDHRLVYVDLLIEGAP